MQRAGTFKRMAYTAPPEFDPTLQLAAEFAERTRVVPQVPIAPAVGALAARLMDEGLMLPERFATFPADLNDTHLDVIEAAAVDEHEPRNLPIPSRDSLRRAAGFVTTSLLTTVDQLFRGREGIALDNIHKPAENDPAIAAATEHLRDPASRTLARAVFDAAAEVLGTETAAQRTAAYRAKITGIAREHGPVGPEDPERFAAKQADLSVERKALSATLENMVWGSLSSERVRGTLALSALQIDVAAHNLTRWQPAPEWFAPPQ